MGLGAEKTRVYGFIDVRGKFVINPRFESALPFGNINGLTPVKLDGMWGLIDKKMASL